MALQRKNYIQTEEGLNTIADKIRNLNLPEHGIVIEIKTGVRTTLQNSAMYKYFELLADALNDAGLEIHMEYLGKDIEVPWTKNSVKERLWLPIMEAMTKKTSTAKLDRNEVSEIYEPLHRHLASTHGVVVPFPDRNEPI